jgi:hypothetical protein
MCGHLAFLHCFAFTTAGRRAHGMGRSDAAFASAYNLLDEMTEVKEQIPFCLNSYLKYYCI